MTRFSDWYISAWYTTKNVAGQVLYIIGKAVPMVGSFIWKIAYTAHNIDNLMSYLLAKLGSIDKVINNVPDHIDSMTGMVSSGLRGKV